MLDASLHELLLVVLWLIETDNHCNSEFLKNGYVVIGGEGAIFIGDIKWSGEGHKLSGNNPVQISVFYLLVMLIFLHIEGFVVVPVKSHSELESPKAILNGALV